MSTLLCGHLIKPECPYKESPRVLQEGRQLTYHAWKINILLLATSLLQAQETYQSADNKAPTAQRTRPQTIGKMFPPSEPGQGWPKPPHWREHSYSQLAEHQPILQGHDSSSLTFISTVDALHFLQLP